MNTRAILSSKGQLVIPKNIRKKMGLHLGSELILKLIDKNILEVISVKQDISRFFGMGNRKDKEQMMSIDDIDQAIGEAVLKNDRS